MPGPHDLAALLPHQRHPRRLRPGDEDVRGAAGRRRPAVRADQRGVEPRRQGDRVRPGEGLPRGAPRRSRTAPWSTRRTSRSSPSTRSPSATTCTGSRSTTGRAARRSRSQGASDDGMSNYFPKYSPDGKWIVFCKAKSYMLLQPDSELYIIPAAGGDARRLRYNTAAHELLAQLVVEQPLAGLLVEGERRRTRSSSSRTSTRTATTARRCCSSASPRRTGPRTFRSSSSCPATPSPTFASSSSTPYSFLRAGHGQRAHRRPQGRGACLSARARARARQRRAAQRARAGRCSRTGGPRRRWRSTSGRWRRIPSTSKSHNNLALALVELGQLDEAAESLRGVARARAEGGDLQRPRLHHGAAGQAGRGARGLPEGARAGSRTARRRTSTWPSTFVQAGAARRGRVPLPPGAARDGPPPRPTTAWATCSPGRAGRTRRSRSSARRSTSTRSSRLPTTTSQRRWRSRGSSKTRRITTGARSRRSRAPAVYNALGAVLRKLGKTDEAADQFGKAKALESAR